MKKEVACQQCRKSFRTESGLRWHLNHSHGNGTAVALTPSSDLSILGDSPVCPRCASHMVLRTTRKGPRAGGQFWGCSRFPECKGTKDTIANSKGLDGDATSDWQPFGLPLVLDDLPRFVSAWPRRVTQQVAFFQSVGLPASWVRTLHDEGIDRVERRRATQWRLDFPMPKDTQLDPIVNSILSVAANILTRGTTPLCSPSIEARVLKEVGRGAAPSELKAALDHVACLPTAPFKPTRFDTPDEGVVFGLMRQWTEGLGGWCFLPQVEIASLVPSAPPEQHERVDLVAVHPALGTYVIEVDGEGHRNEEEKDTRRDATLSDAGFPTIRVPNEEARAGQGPRLSIVSASLKATQV